MCRKFIFIIIMFFMIMGLSQRLIAKEHGSLGVGWNKNFKYDLNELNNEFESRNIGEIKGNNSTFNICIHMFSDESKFVFGCDARFSIRNFTRENEGDSLTSKLNELSVTYDLGYLLLNNKSVSIYPLLGLGVSKNSLTIYPNGVDEISWSEISDSKHLELFRRNIVIKSSLRTEFLLIKIRGGKSTIPIGIETGYLLQIPISDIKMTGFIDIPDFPDFRLGGMFLNFTIGYRD